MLCAALRVLHIKDLKDLRKSGGADFYRHLGLTDLKTRGPVPRPMIHAPGTVARGPVPRDVSARSLHGEGQALALRFFGAVLEWPNEITQK